MRFDRPVMAAANGTSSNSAMVRPTPSRSAGRTDNQSVAVVGSPIATAAMSTSK
jgi:hypothetical protein